MSPLLPHSLGGRAPLPPGPRRPPWQLPATLTHFCPPLSPPPAALLGGPGRRGSLGRASGGKGSQGEGPQATAAAPIPMRPTGLQPLGLPFTFFPHLHRCAPHWAYSTFAAGPILRTQPSFKVHNAKQDQCVPCNCARRSTLHFAIDMAYAGRASHGDDGSLVLKNVRSADAGTYHCVLKTFDRPAENPHSVHIKLQVQSGTASLLPIPL